MDAVNPTILDVYLEAIRLLFKRLFVFRLRWTGEFIKGVKESIQDVREPNSPYLEPIRKVV